MDGRRLGSFSANAAKLLSLVRSLPLEEEEEEEDEESISGSACFLVVAATAPLPPPPRPVAVVELGVDESIISVMSS